MKQIYQDNFRVSQVILSRKSHSMMRHPGSRAACAVPAAGMWDKRSNEATAALTPVG